MFLLSGCLFLGISHIALLPPWEGFDEEAHYSYLQQIADTFSLPRYGRARFSEDVEEYETIAPMYYGFNGLCYKNFFEGSPHRLTIAEKYIHSHPKKPRNYTEGKDFNYESQHPPLYYLILTPFYLATRHLSWGCQLFILRLISYFFAWLALIIGLYACYRCPISGGNAKEPSMPLHLLGIGIWPILFPAWFPDMARLGNDSLCALIASSIWLITILALKNGPSIKYWISLGVLLALGCITKAFFVPVTFGIISFWFFHGLIFKNKEKRGPISLNLLITLVIILLFSGWWYILNWWQFGVIFGNLTSIELQKMGGFLGNLIRNFSVFAWLRGHAAFITTIAWCPTVSGARPPYIFLAPMAFEGLFVAILYCTTLPRYQTSEIRWLPLWFIVPMLLALSFYVLVCIALYGEGRGTPGFYLQFLVAPLGFALGSSLGAWWSKKSWRIVGIILATYSIFLSVATSWLQLLLFSGIIGRSEDKFYQFPDVLPPFLGLPEAISRLKVLAFPQLGIVAWMLGGIMVVVGMACAWKSISHSGLS